MENVVEKLLCALVLAPMNTFWACLVVTENSAVRFKRFVDT